MTNLATLIGAQNLEILINQPENTYLVIEGEGGQFFTKQNTNTVNHAFTVGIGTYKACDSLANYLNLQKLATS